MIASATATMIADHEVSTGCAVVLGGSGRLVIIVGSPNRRTSNAGRTLTCVRSTAPACGSDRANREPRVSTAFVCLRWYEVWPGPWSPHRSWKRDREG